MIPAGAAEPRPASAGVRVGLVSGGTRYGNATVVAQTGPGDTCGISCATPVGSAVAATGLGPQAADANGRVSWT